MTEEIVVKFHENYYINIQALENLNLSKEEAEELKEVIAERVSIKKLTELIVRLSQIKQLQSPENQ